MVLFTVEKIRELMDDPDKARIFSITSSSGPDPSSIVDHLISRAGIVLSRYPNRYYDDCRDEPDRTIKTQRNHNSILYYETRSKEAKENSECQYILNLIHLQLGNLLPIQVSDSLRIIDGLLVVVNCQAYLSVQAEVILRQAMRERIKLIVIVGNLEKNIVDLQQDAETIYQQASKAISAVNIVTSSYQHPDMGDLKVSPEEGNVAFVSEKYGWGFTLMTFANIYAKKFGTDTSKLISKFWGDNFYDPDNKQWLSTQVKTEDGRTLNRAFVQFIMNPIIKLTRCIMNGDMQQLDKILDKLGIELSKEDRNLKSDSLVKKVLSSWINAADCLLEMVVIHLPSPKTAQKYRTSCLYEGPQDDVCAEAMRECDPKGPLMVYISQLIPCNNTRRFYAMGRVFSGTVESGKKVRIMGQGYNQGKKEDLVIKPLHGVCITVYRDVESVSNISSGNIVYLAGIDQYLLNSGTISDCEEAHQIRTTHCSVSPIIRVAVEPKNPADLPKFIENLKRLSKSDPIVQIEHAETGEHFIAGYSDVHLEICLKSCQDYANCEIKQSELFITYKESISQTSQFCMAKSPNKHNRLYCTAQPLSEDLCQAIEKSQIGPKVDPVLRTKRLTEEFGWDTEDASQIWTFGPNSIGPNVLVNMTTGVQFINEIKDSCEAAFQWISKEGVLCEENMRQFRANIVDVSLHSDAIHRGGGQIIPAVRRVFYACQLTAQPRLQEPIYLVEITSTKEALNQVYECLAKKRGTILEEKPIEAMPVQLIKCHLPVAESIGFISYLTSLTNGSAFAHFIENHWLEIEEDPLDISSSAFKIMTNIRKRKGLRETPLDFMNYMDNF